MLTRLSIPRPHPDVVDTCLPNGDVVLLHLNSKQYYSLNQTGSRLWQLMHGNRTVEQLGTEVEGSYDISIEEARQCVVDFAQQLAAEDLVIVQEAGSMVNNTE